MEENNKEENNKEEKKGDPLNQLAIIADLIEKINFNPSMSSIVFEFEHEEFLKISDIIQKKAHILDENVDYRFRMRIGTIDYIFISQDFFDDTSS